MKKVLFIDRDGTIIREPEDFQIDSFEKLSFLPHAISQLKKIVQELDYELVMVTNQDGLGTDSFPEDTFWPVHNLMLDVLKNEGISFHEILIDRSFEQDNAPTRKPRTGMLTHYMESNEYDLSQSYVIGDRKTDIELAINLGARAVFISDDTDKRAELTTTDWHEIYTFLKGKKQQTQGRAAHIHRKTHETDIDVSIDLDGSGKSELNTGIGFFDHMLHQIARHAKIDLTIAVNGDLHIDEHHTIEDLALTLGDAFQQALGDKRGIERYGFSILPMDETLAQVALDFSGRPWLMWNADFKREKVGGMPTEMFMHFFKSFSDTAKCNLNIQVQGDNEHHMIEAIFKSFAKAIRMAIHKDPDNDEIPSTKGVL
ncbi:bifunctional histidinol-phosphatase/imidazoleglycerol-phosphate dehydratase HisB [Limibacter armeniacum]|uniref:bifunctional histidinol-phosphatase/imidazoleglycerol-phosphate dehydratase HisB n=1 Tax=Limibacter armeniacum TaxID=466084 RepID=UPI002FE5A3F5